MDKIEEILIAPCGMNCSYCSAYLNYKYGQKGKLRGKCSGCLPSDKHCAFLKQRCELLKNKKIRFCFECNNFPCEQLLKLDRRYRKKHWLVSFSGNNRRIQEVGLGQFIKEQNKKWSCRKCKGPVSIQERECYQCGDIINQI